MQVDNELAYNNAMIMEREQGISEIHEQIQEVNEIFQDLAILVNDQGAMLGSQLTCCILQALSTYDIEANIVRTAYKTKDAAQELKKADRSQRRSRNKVCFLFLSAGLYLIFHDVPFDPRKTPLSVTFKFCSTAINALVRM
eukprot:96040-Prorocentrum_minimum.AAC.2